MTTVTLVLNWLLLGWLIWPILTLGLLIPYWLVKGMERDFASPAFIPIAIAIGAAWWRWPAVFPHTWGGAALVAGLYLAAGAVYSGVKYLQTLRRFQGDVQHILAQAPNLELVDKVARLEANLTEWGRGWDKGYEIANGVAQLNWRCLPLANWWVWWPWFLCGSAFELVSNLGNHLVAAFKGFYQGLAKRFAVKLRSSSLSSSPQ